MSVLFSPFGNQQFVSATGAPATGWKIYTYVAGSSTPLATYTESTGATPQTNPIVINSLGFPTTGQVWLTSGLAYKLVLTDENGVVKKTEDNITGVTGTSTVSQWQASGLTPTYVSATSFTLAGDQSSDFHVNRRLQTTNTSGTIYSRISAVAYTTLTTVTVVNDSGVLDSGLSQVNYGLLRATNTSVPLLTVAQGGTGKTTDTGQVLQVQYFNYGTPFTMSSGTPAATPFTQSITPRNTSSKVMIQFSLGDVVSTSPANGVGIYIYKNGVLLVRTNMRAAYYSSGATTVRNGGPAFYVDSPATASAVTYTVYIDNGGAGSASVCFENSFGSLVLTEIAG